MDPTAVLLALMDTGTTDERELLKAVRRRDYHTIQRLLEARTRPTATDKDGRTPLLVASEEASKDRVALLLEAMADPNVPSRFGRTPLDTAVYASLRYPALFQSSVEVLRAQWRAGHNGLRGPKEPRRHGRTRTRARRPREQIFRGPLQDGRALSRLGRDRTNHSRNPPGRTCERTSHAIQERTHRRPPTCGEHLLLPRWPPTSPYLHPDDDALVQRLGHAFEEWDPQSVSWITPFIP